MLYKNASTNSGTEDGTALPFNLKNHLFSEILLTEVNSHCFIAVLLFCPVRFKVLLACVQPSPPLEKADLATEWERQLTTGRRAERTKRDFHCSICRSAIGQASCLLCSHRRQLTFPFCR